MSIIEIKPPSERRPGPEPAGRVCEQQGCDTRLSRWNTTDRCSQHGGWPQKRIVKSVRELHDLRAA